LSSCLEERRNCVEDGGGDEMKFFVKVLVVLFSCLEIFRRREEVFL